MAESVDARRCEASVPADKDMILGRLAEFEMVGHHGVREKGGAKNAAAKSRHSKQAASGKAIVGRDGTHELNRRIARAVQRGW